MHVLSLERYIRGSSATKGQLVSRIVIILSKFYFRGWFLLQIVENRKMRLSRLFLGPGDYFEVRYLPLVVPYRHIPLSREVQVYYSVVQLYMCLEYILGNKARLALWPKRKQKYSIIKTAVPLSRERYGRTTAVDLVQWYHWIHWKLCITVPTSEESVLFWYLLKLRPILVAKFKTLHHHFTRNLNPKKYDFLILCGIFWDYFESGWNFCHIRCMHMAIM